MLEEISSNRCLGTTALGVLLGSGYSLYLSKQLQGYATNALVGMPLDYQDPTMSFTKQDTIDRSSQNDQCNKLSKYSEDLRRIILHLQRYVCINC